MPAVTSHHQLASKRNRNGGSVSSVDSTVPLYILHEMDHGKPQRDAVRSLKTLAHIPSHRNLRIDPYAEPDPHDRYHSSEEEASPSSDDGFDITDEALSKQSPVKPDEQQTQESAQLSAPTEKVYEESVIDLYLSRGIESEPQVARAIPILALGRPKLVEIATLAPMQKRKRVSDPVLLPSPKTPKPATKQAPPPPPPATGNQSASIAEAHTGAKVVEHKKQHKARRTEAPHHHHQVYPMAAPATWLPEDSISIHNDLYIPDLLELPRSKTSYSDYDPYSLEPPRLHHHQAAHNNPRRMMPNNSSRVSLRDSAAVAKAVGRSLSLTKKNQQSQQSQQSKQQQQQPVAKRTKMVARGAAERRDTPIIPPFPFEDGDARSVVVA